MRFSMVLALLLCPMSAAAVAAEEEFPYVGYIRTDGAEVHADFVGQHPPTGTLDKGTPVEVYRHELNGWCAIRPPAGSFTWVSARHLTNPDDENLATVLDDRVGAWVGTSLSNARLARHVSLKQGEVVELLSAHEFVVDGRRESWYKIAPPAGEFRWVEARHIDRQPPAGTEVATAAHSEPIAEDEPEETSAADQGDLRPIGTASEIRLAQWIARQETSRPAVQAKPSTASAPRTAASPAKTPAPATNSSPPAARPSHIVVFPINRNASSAADEAPNPSANLSASTALAPSPDSSPPAPDSLEEQLQQLDLDLSYAVSHEPTLEKLVALRERADALLGQGTTVKVRARARLMQDKIRRFEEIHRRYELLASGASPAAGIEPIAPTGSGVAASPGSSETLGKPQFDGQGWLMPLVSNAQNRRSGDVNLPPFALTDDHGNVLQLVSPAPGMNLRRYVRTRVGVFGQRGYIPHLQANHLTARQVVTLDSTQR